MGLQSKLTFLISLICSLACSQKAILMSSSLGYYNIRQVNNIVKIYQHFRNNGFKDEDITLMIGEQQACCQKNHIFSQLSFYDGDYTNIFKNVEIDQYESGMYLESVSKIMMGFYLPFTLNKKRLKLKNEPLFIYITGHGGDLYFKIRERQAIINEQFNTIFHTISEKKDVSKIVIFSDSCSAITPFEQVTTPNFLAFGSSSFNEKSLSHGYDSLLNQPKTDDFTFYFDEILNEKAQAKGISRKEDWSFKQIKKYMSLQRLKVNSKIVANKINPSQRIKSFIKREQTEGQHISLKRIKPSFFKY